MTLDIVLDKWSLGSGIFRFPKDEASFFPDHAFLIMLDERYYAALCICLDSDYCGIVRQDNVYRADISQDDHALFRGPITRMPLKSDDILRFKLVKRNPLTYSVEKC